MPYIALKTVKFDKSYVIGEIIQETVIAPEMIEKLVNCGIIQKQVSAKQEAGKPKQSKKENFVENL